MIRGHRRAGSENVLFRVTYSVLAGWTGLRVSTLKQYAQRGLFDPREPGSVLRFVLERRGFVKTAGSGRPE